METAMMEMANRAAMVMVWVLVFAGMKWDVECCDPPLGRESKRDPALASSEEMKLPGPGCKGVA